MQRTNANATFVTVQSCLLLWKLTAVLRVFIECASLRSLLPFRLCASSSLMRTRVVQTCLLRLGNRINVKSSRAQHREAHIQKRAGSMLATLEFGRGQRAGRARFRDHTIARAAGIAGEISLDSWHARAPVTNDELKRTFEFV